MALRIYAIGLVQFVIVALVIELDHQAREASRRATIAAERAAMNGQDDRRPAPPWEGHARFVADGLGRVIDEPRALQQEVERAARDFAWSVEVRDPDGHVLAHARPGTPPPPDGRRRTTPIRLKDGREARLEYTPHRGPGGPGGPGAGGPGGPPPFMGPGGPPPFGGPDGPRPPLAPPIGLAVAVVLVVVGVSSWLTARSFARPLASLSDRARAFGKGELDARARMDRGDEIGEVAQAFDDMADRIAKLLLAERELLANVSHELRTPLARIRVALDIASESDPKSAIESFSEIAQDLAELERIVDDVLASARLALDSGPRSGGGTSLPVRAEVVDARALLERSVNRFKGAHPERPLIVELDDALPSIDVDAVLVRRVIDNLLDNAHKYSERADAAISLRARESDEGTMFVEIQDEGIGISEEDQRRLFEPFFRVDRSRNRATGGLGLGLVLARRVVEAHGGTLTIESEAGKGTTARVVLPIAR
jgi:two-component system OmpR family sensor kinase